MSSNTDTWTSIKDGLPPLGEEVIVLDIYERISFGHIVDPEEAISYDGWNIPSVVFWKPFGYTQEMFDYYGYEELEGGEATSKSATGSSWRNGSTRTLSSAHASKPAPTTTTCSAPTAR